MVSENPAAEHTHEEDSEIHEGSIESTIDIDIDDDGRRTPVPLRLENRSYPIDDQMMVLVIEINVGKLSHPFSIGNNKQ